jgi:hypothetical protein
MTRSKRTNHHRWFTIDDFFINVKLRKSLRVQRHFVGNEPDLDILLLRALEGHPLLPAVCLPEFHLCVTNGLITHHRNACLPDSFLAIETGLLVTDYKWRAILHVPQNLEMYLDQCRTRARYVVCNFGLYPDRDFSEGHSNTLLFDLKNRAIERFCPGTGKDNRALNELDRQIKVSFKLILPLWKYRGIVDAPTKAIQDITRDKEFCVAHSLHYLLLRLLNPSRLPSEITHYMIRGSREQILNRTLHVNEQIINILNRGIHKQSGR